MKNLKKAIIVLAVTAIVWIVADIILAALDGTGTISQAMKYLGQRCATFPMIIGLLIGHFFFMIPVVMFKQIRNILLVCLLVWFGWDLFNGIVGNWSVAGSGIPSWIMCIVGIGLGRLLWPQGTS